MDRVKRCQMVIDPSTRPAQRLFLTFSVVFISNGRYTTSSADICQKKTSGRLDLEWARQKLHI